MSIEDGLRFRIARACRVLGKMELTRALRGHISARIPGTDRIFIRARGPAESGVRYTTEDEVVEIGLDGKPVAGMPQGLRTPSEVFIHTEIFRARPRVNAVLHLHPPIVVLFTVTGVPLLPICGAYDPQGLGLALEEPPTFESSVLIDTPELGRELSAVIGDKRACLMRGHGITTAADSIEEAAVVALSLNELATMNYQARALGTPRPISESDREALSPAMKRLMKRGPRPGEPGDSVVTEWRYYCRLTGEDGGT
ncbi:MAG TPA: class II aldolase/adducin family protein [Micropepsaceae bacterium]|jgi:L-fuculose-phosphate aldolase